MRVVVIVRVIMRVVVVMHVVVRMALRMLMRMAVAAETVGRHCLTAAAFIAHCAIPLCFEFAWIPKQLNIAQVRRPCNRQVRPENCEFGLPAERAFGMRGIVGSNYGFRCSKKGPSS